MKQLNLPFRKKRADEFFTVALPFCTVEAPFIAFSVFNPINTVIKRNMFSTPFLDFDIRPDNSHLTHHRGDRVVIRIYDDFESIEDEFRKFDARYPWEDRRWNS